MLFPNTFIITTSTVLPKSHKAPDSYINVTVDFGADVGMIPLNSIVEKTQAYKLKQRITYKLINKYILEKYNFKVHTVYIAEVKCSLGHAQPDNIPTTLAIVMGKVITDTPLEHKEGIPSHPEGVDLLPANIELSGMEVSLINAMSRETILKQYLDTLKKK